MEKFWSWTRCDGHPENAVIAPPVRGWVDKLYPNVVYWAEHQRGGHFAAPEVADTFVDDVRNWFRSYPSHLR